MNNQLLRDLFEAFTSFWRRRKTSGEAKPTPPRKPGVVFQYEREPIPPPSDPPVIVRAPPRPYLETLRRRDAGSLTMAHYQEKAAHLACEWEALAAVAQVESGGRGGFGSDGRPVILFERHLFSRKTNSQYDLTNPKVSSRAPGGYPRTQEGRYEQLAEAYALNSNAALESTSWGSFQLLGQNYPTMRMTSAHDYVHYLSLGELQQLEGFIAYCRYNNALPALRDKNWPTFARIYNGRDYAINRYDVKMAEAYARIKSAQALV